MKSRKTRLGAIAAVVVAAGTTVGALAATSASASTTFIPRPVHHACAANLNGYNVLDLTFQGNVFKYPIFLHVQNNGLINGVLVDSNLPVGQQVLRLHGICIGDNVLADVNYPVADPQGSRAENMVILPVPLHPHRGTVAGVWGETGTEAGAGLATLENTVHIYS
jgi:hypothetical protein